MTELIIRVAVIDDEETMRDSLRYWCQQQSGFQYVGGWPTIGEALDSMTWSKPHVLLLDLHLAGSESLKSIEELKIKVSGLAVLMLTGEDDYYWIEQALQRGADGYLSKKAAPHSLAQALRDVLQGGSPLTPDISRKLISEHIVKTREKSAIDQLTPRERMVLAKLAQGLVYKEIADHCEISVETVRTHARRIFKKLNVGTKTEAVLKYLKATRSH